MSTVLAGPRLRERLCLVIDWAVQGTWPAGDCTACKARADGWCEECTLRRAALADLDETLARVRSAATDAEALAGFLVTFAALGGADLDTRLAVWHAASPPEITPAQREFACRIVSDAIRWTTPCDEDESKRRAAYEDARDRVRTARTIGEIGTAMTGGK